MKVWVSGMLKGQALFVMGILVSMGCDPTVKRTCESNAECMDNYLCSKEKQCVEVQQKELRITIDELPKGIIGQDYHVKLSVVGGLEPYHWSVDSDQIWLKVENETTEEGPIWRLAGVPNEMVADVQVTIVVRDDSIGDGQKTDQQLGLNILACFSDQDQPCFGNGACNPTGACECLPGYAGVQCKTCDFGYQQDLDGNCVGYEYRCVGAECEASPQRRRCADGQCEEWTDLPKCQSGEICWANQTGAGCFYCQGTCEDGKCTACSHGPCCDTQTNTILPAGRQCSERKEYFCSSEACGSSAQEMTINQVCNGVTAGCHGEITDIDIKTIEVCNTYLEMCESEKDVYADCTDCQEFGICESGSCTCKYNDCSGTCCKQSESCTALEKCGLTDTIMASDRKTSQRFGYSVAAYEDYIIVGAPYDNEKGYNAGAAYIFQRTQSGWIQHPKILAYDGSSDDKFGQSVSIHQDYAIVGANGDDDLEKGQDVGSAYIYRNGPEGWVLEKKLSPIDEEQAGDNFGYAVAVFGDYAVVGAPYDDYKEGDVIHIENSGAAYVFHRLPEGWIQVKKLIAEDKEQGDDLFGVSVSISGDYAIVGAYFDDMYDGDVKQYDNSGAAYVFHHSPSGWIQKKKLTLNAASSPHDYQYGRTVSISGDYAVIGGKSREATILHRVEDDWVSEATTKSCKYVSIFGGYAVVSQSNSAYVYSRDQAGWKLQTTLNNKDQIESISISDEYIILGSPYSYGDANNPISQSGAVYIQ